MLGFFTLLSLLFAFGKGGWGWAVFAVFFLAWLGKRNEAKELKDTAVKVDSNELLSEDWPAELLKACSSLTNAGYYVGDLIPKKKYESAWVSYPLPGDRNILALIDATVFGSASCGLAIGKDGIAWKNDFEGPVQISWKNLADSALSSSGSYVSVGAFKFNISGSGIKRSDVEALLLRLQAYARSLATKDHSIAKGQKCERLKAARPATETRPVVSINNATFEELLTLPGIGAAEAHLIIKRRGEQIFESSMELVDYLELKPHIASKLDVLIDFGQPLTAPQAQTKAPKQTSRNVPPRATTVGGRTID
jgi:hypothetical protein